MKAERVGQDVAEFAAHSRREQEKGFIGFAKVQVMFDEEQMDVEHRFGEVNKRPLIEKHVKQLLNNYVGQGRHDQAHPLVVMVDEDAPASLGALDRVHREEAIEDVNPDSVPERERES